VAESGAWTRRAARMVVVIIVIARQHVCGEGT